MNTYLYIGGVNIDLFEDVPITIDYSLTDIMQPASRRVSHTKTIELPNTPNNASVFHQLFVINKDNTISGYDPNLRVVAFVQNGSGNLIEGYFQLTGIVKNGNDIKYQGVIYSDEKNLFSQMGDSFIQGNPDSANDVDLDIGTTPLVYRPADYQKAFVNGFVASGSAAELFTIDSGTNTTQSSAPFYNIPFTNLRMAMKFKHIWDRIFTKYNTTYSSTFLNSTRFKSMMYLDTHKTANLTTTQANDIVAYLSLSTPTAYASGNVTFKYDTEIQDIGNRYSISTGVYTPNSIRDYRFGMNTNFDLRITFNTPTTIVSPTFVSCSFSSLIYKNGVVLPNSGVKFVSIAVPAGSYLTGQVIDTIAYNVPLAFTWDAQTGDLITFRYQVQIVNANGLNVTLSGRVLSGSTIYIQPANNQLALNDTYNKNSLPAAQHKQKDFIIDVLRMFNLYVLFDGVNYIIEPRDNFFELGTTYDWTMKIDRSQPIEIVPVGQLNWKQMQFVAKADADYYSTQYLTNNKEVYGQQNVFNQNDFINDVKRVELNFAPPMTVSMQANYPKLQHIYKLNNGVAEAIDGMPRYAYWGGWKEEGTVLSQITGAGTAVEYDGYAYVGEFDDPNTPTFSVLFGPPRQVYYQTFGILGITDNDLYSAYYQNELMNQVSANAKVIKCSVLLQPLEVNNLRLYDTVIVDGVRCIISKISDYNTTTIQPTQVELIQYVQ